MGKWNDPDYSWSGLLQGYINSRAVESGRVVSEQRSREVKIERKTIERRKKS